MELSADFLSQGRGSVKLVLEQEYTITYSLRRSDTSQVGINVVLGDSSPVFRAFSIVFLIELFFYNDFPIATYIVLLILACIKY